MTNASNVVLTARTKNVQLATLSGNFTTSSATFVDVTGMTLSVPNNFWVSARYDSQGTTNTVVTRFVHGAGPTVDQLGGNVSTSRLTKAFGIVQNISGGSVTYKLQAEIVAGTLYTMFQTGSSPPASNNMGSVMAFAPFAIQDSFAVEQINISMKAIITSIDFFPMGTVSVNFMGGSSIGRQTTLDTVTLNNLINSMFYEFSASATYAEGGSAVASTLGVFLFYDYSGSDVTLS